MTLAEPYVKWSFILADRLDPEILATLEIRNKLILHCVRLHLKVPGWLSHLNVLLIVKSLLL